MHSKWLTVWLHINFKNIKKIEFCLHNRFFSIVFRKKIIVILIVYPVQCDLFFSHLVCCICVICFRSVVTLGSMGRVYPVQNLIIVNNKQLCIYKQEIGTKVIKIINYLVRTCITIKNTNKKSTRHFDQKNTKRNLSII